MGSRWHQWTPKSSARRPNVQVPVSITKCQAFWFWIEHASWRWTPAPLHLHQAQQLIDSGWQCWLCALQATKRSKRRWTNQLFVRQTSTGLHLRRHILSCWYGLKIVVQAPNSMWDSSSRVFNQTILSRPSNECSGPLRYKRQCPPVQPTISDLERPNLGQKATSDGHREGASLHLPWVSWP